MHTRQLLHESVPYFVNKRAPAQELSGYELDSRKKLGPAIGPTIQKEGFHDRTENYKDSSAPGDSYLFNCAGMPIVERIHQSHNANRYQPLAELRNGGHNRNHLRN